MKKATLAAALFAAVGLSSSLLGSVPAAADDLDYTLHRLHEACHLGDRGACVRFGILIGENRERREEWRHAHPEWFGWWER